MSDREQIIIKRILAYLKSNDGTPVVETLIQAHAGLGLTPRLTTTEFDLAMKVCDECRWVKSVQGKLSIKWDITESGESALLEM